MGHEWPWVKLGSHSLRQTFLSTKSKNTEPFPLLIPALVSVSLLFHPSCLSRSSVRLARAHQRCPELLRGTQSLGDLFLPPQCNLLLLLPSYESVSLLQHKVHLAAHVAPPELLRGKVTFFTWENKTNKEIAFSKHKVPVTFWSRWATVTAAWKKNKKLFQPAVMLYYMLRPGHM